MENSTAENSAANNPAGLKTDISKTYKSKTDGINKREIDRAREGLPHRYGTYANVLLTDEEIPRTASLELDTEDIHSDCEVWYDKETNTVIIK